MTVKELKQWFAGIPEKLEDREIEVMDIDLTRGTAVLNLVTKQNGTVVIKTLHREPNYIDED